MKEDYYDEKFERNKEIVDKVESGISLTQLAKDYNVSRQRIHQIYSRGKSIHKNLITLPEWCKLTNTLRSTAISNFRCGKLKGRRIGNRYYIEKDTR